MSIAIQYYLHGSVKGTDGTEGEATAMYILRIISYKRAWMRGDASSRLGSQEQCCYIRYNL